VTDPRTAPGTGAAARAGAGDGIAAGGGGGTEGRGAAGAGDGGAARRLHHPLAALGPLGRRLLLAFVAVAGAAVVLVVAAAMVGTTRGLSSAEQVQRDDVAAGVARAAAQAYQRAGGWDGANFVTALSLAEVAGARAIIRDADGKVLAATGTGMGGGIGGGPGGSGTPGGGGRTGGGQGYRVPGGSVTGTSTDLGTGTGVDTGTGAAPTGETADAGTTPGTGTDGSGGGSGTAGTGAGTGTVTVPVTVDGHSVGTVTVGFAGSVSSPGRTIAWTWIVAAAIAAALLALALGYGMSRLLTRPVVALTEAARAFGAGDRAARPAVRGHGELAELATAFEEAAETVARTEDMRRQMAADVAHELRTPLAALQAELEELRDGLVPADPGTLARLHDQSLRLARVVDDLSELSSAEASTLGMVSAPVDLARLVRDEVAAREAQLRAAGLAVTVTVPDEGGDAVPAGSGSAVPAVVLGDEARLHQVVGNLLQNCARHCRSGDTVSVQLDGPRPPESGAADGGATWAGGELRAEWRVVVADTGPGIPPEELPHVFARFWRGTGAERSRGSGLGLAVVQALVQAHGGDVHLDSDGTSGTTVTVTLPAAPRTSPLH
jgi:two-component system, OmpR family, sensor histidine kinase BaeS